MKVPAATEAQKKMCSCPECPTYVECGERVFCIAGKSKCIKTEIDCLCPGCPLQKKMNFIHAYYCTRGAEAKK